MTVRHDLLLMAGVPNMIHSCETLGLAGKWYLFGSAMRGEAMPADIDILCVVDSYKIGAQIFQAVEDHLLEHPIDLRILSADDERELAFICRASCVSLSRDEAPEPQVRTPTDSF